jgi:hypothetical protein
MSITYKTRRAIAYAWLMRSQPTSPLFDGAQADRLLARHEDLIKDELSRAVGLRDIPVEYCIITDTETSEEK